MDPYDYSKISDHEKSFLPVGFSGNVYNMSYKWTSIIPVTRTPVKILEIGAYHGANACCLLKTYATHPDSELHCLDPWQDSLSYPEYKGKQAKNYKLFLGNISKLSEEDINKVYVHRTSSVNVDNMFDDEMFDIIYIDGNHVPYFVLQDAVLSLKKVKVGGTLVFDDVFDEGVRKGMEAFLSISINYIDTEVKCANGQAFVKKKSSAI